MLGSNKTESLSPPATSFKAQIDEARVNAEKQAITTQNAVIKVTNQIRRSLDFSVICETATQEMLDLLSADRVAIYRFNSDWSGRFISEARGSEWISLVEAQQHNSLISKNVSDCSAKLLDTHQVADTHLQMTYGGAFVQGKVFRVCEDVQNAGFSDCYLDVLKSYQARSYAIIAIYLNNQLWGLLAAYQNAGPRRWKENEVQLLVQVAEQLGIALKQAEYVQTIQNQNIKLNETLQQLKQSQAQLVQSEKMASLGQLVAGVAHEINNPVSFVRGNLQPAQEYAQDVLRLLDLYRQHYPNPDPSIAKALDELDIEFIQTDFPNLLNSMKMGTQRIQSIVSSLRNFSRLDESDFKTADIHEGLENTLLILNHHLSAQPPHPPIELIKRYGELPLIHCFPSQLNQVFVNLLVNAIDALRHNADDSNREFFLQSNPTITLQTESVDNDVRITIADNGTGIPADVIGKLFDPFFTTKPIGKGTGLGLSICHQIITEKHGGSLKCRSTVGEGTAFIIQIPTSISVSE